MTGAALTPRPVTPTSILAAELTELCGELGTVAGLPAAVLDRAQRAAALAAGLDPYLDRCTSPESPALARLSERTAHTDWTDRAETSVFLEQEMLSGHVEGKTLQFLLHLSRCTRVLEIGMFTGYSALAMAEALPSGGTVLACEIDPDVARFARECFDASPVGNRITIAVGPALETLQQLPDTEPPFDFVFIDADKAGYLGYVDFLLSSPLLGPEAVIAVDNTLMQGQPYTGTGVTANGVAIATFNQAIADDPRVEQVLIPLRDGLTLIRRTPA